jgi:hypothetical protein
MVDTRIPAKSGILRESVFELIAFCNEMMAHSIGKRRFFTQSKGIWPEQWCGMVNALSFAVH